ncbi:testis-specific Y-encoded-like protein 2 isoform X2 [Senna tora]|uniref:Testis-specific Y-encoded-like protein 2 isoform X2 n=1 Tax=Senna tora TaxID=362788 RepID=A0A834TGM0_9FABA|nr:testis-specific Y-encoded-like protein 2 isoform X2 [Senna tora]
MEVEVSDPKPIVEIRRENSDKDRVRVKRKTLQTVLEQCQRALELLNTASGVDDDEEGCEVETTMTDEGRRLESSRSMRVDREAEELCDLLKSQVECPAFLEKLEFAQASVSQNAAEEGNSWDMVSENDLWEGEDIDSDQEDYVLVRQEDIVEGIACFMAAYLLSLKQTKDLTPNQLQEALSKTFSTKKKKGKLRKAWDGSKVIYNVASWGATAIGIYQNPVILRAATKAFWTSCHVISKLL